MKQWIIVIFSLLVLYSCDSSKSKNQFDVDGIITNNNSKIIYLEEVPMATMKRIVVDSAVINNGGRYSLHTKSEQESVFNLRLSGSSFPLASVINDKPKITVDVFFSGENRGMFERYEVKGSPASQLLKDFIYKFTDLERDLYVNGQRIDSLIKANVSDTITNPMVIQNNKAADDIRNYLLASIKQSNSPSLTMFELGYFQSTANNPAFRTEPLSNDQVLQIVDDLAKRFPNNNGITIIKKSFDEEIKKSKGWIGKNAPEISLPDVNGKEIKLSSFKGKYVLVDFWASWCNPCRHENPNVVKVYNEFKDKNFTVLGVSLDKEKNDWIQAIQKDGLAWTQISDLKEWASPVVDLYNFGDIGIPFNVLIAPDGKVIAQELRGSALEEKLKEVLK